MTTHWNAFLPIGKFPDEPGLDPAWAAAMGVDKDALLVLRAVRRTVLPTVRSLGKRGLLKSFSFLVHDHSSGVPCPPEDPRAFIHLRIETDGILPLSGWAYVSRVKPTKAERLVQAVLHKQSEWYLNLVEDNAALSDVDLLQRIGRTLHYFANMAQMMVR